jgi:hypothetical protein
VLIVAHRITASRTRPTPRGSRFLVAHAEDVEEASMQQDPGDRDRNVREQDDDVAPARARQAAQDPRVDLLDRVRVLLLYERLHGGEEGGDGDAGQDERRATRAGSGRPPDRIGDHHRDRPAEEGGRRQRVLEVDPAQINDRDGRTQPGTGSHAEQVRVG